MDKTVTFTEAELAALDAAADAGLEYLDRLIHSPGSNELTRTLTERSHTLMNLQRTKIKEALRNPSSTMRSITFTKTELIALRDATDAAMRARKDAIPHADVRKKIEEAYHSSFSDQR